MGTDWTRFYDATGAEPRETLVTALDAFGETTGFAVDLGCGTGRDTFELLRRGWRVLAVDAEPRGIERLRSAVPPEHSSRLETKVARMEDADWPSADLVNSSFALPFCPPERFPELWSRIVGSLRPGGRVCGQLFGDRDGWAPDPELTFHTRAELERLLDGLDVELLDEEEEDSQTALGEPKHWHVFHLVARRTG